MIEINTRDIQKLSSLKAGDIVSLSGTLYTARDAAHKKLFELLSNGQPLPFDLKDAFIYYTGATPEKEGEPIGSCGPTTSSRMDKYTPLLLERGVKAVIGKGGRGDAVIRAIAANSAVYFAAIGGAGAYYKSTVTSCELIAFPELLSEAVYRLTVKDFRCAAAVDSKGNSIF